MSNDSGSADQERTGNNRLTVDEGPYLRKPLFIGVVTKDPTRRTAIDRTWGLHAQKLIFFSSSTKEGEPGSNPPLVSLPGVNDGTYPPHQKAYHVLKYVHDNFINDYDWFVRADDDMYIRVVHLLHFLSRLNPNHEQCITGRMDSGGLENLNSGEQLYDGVESPGTIFSRALLKKLAPHLDNCLVNTTTSQNDADKDIGRCVSQRFGVHCTENQEVH